MIMCVLLCYPVSIRIYYQQGVLFLVRYRNYLSLWEQWVIMKYFITSIFGFASKKSIYLQISKENIVGEHKIFWTNLQSEESICFYLLFLQKTAMFNFDFFLVCLNGCFDLVCSKT